MKWIASIALIISISFGVTQKKKPPEPVFTIHVPKEYKYASKYQEIADNFKYLEDSIIIPIEKHFGIDLRDGRRTITSTYRPWDKDSDHSHGKALDINMRRHPSPVTNRQIYEYVRDSLSFDQLIIYNYKNYPTHVHMSFRNLENRAEKYLCRFKKYKPL